MADFWDALFPDRQEEETAADPSAEPESLPAMVKEPEGRYGGRGRTVQAGAAAAFVAVLVGGVLLWKEVRHRPATDAAPAVGGPGDPRRTGAFRRSRRAPRVLRRPSLDSGGENPRPVPNLLFRRRRGLPRRPRLRASPWRVPS